jgi:hypothetical protein
MIERGQRLGVLLRFSSTCADAEAPATHRAASSNAWFDGGSTANAGRLAVRVDKATREVAQIAVEKVGF